MDLNNIYKICIKKFDCHMNNYDKIGEFGGNVVNGDYYKEGVFNDFYGMYNWMTSFVTGLAPLYYRTEKDTYYLKWANMYADDYRRKIFEHPLETMHDIGFLYSPYSVAMYQLTGALEHRNTALKAADELLKRFDINGKYIDAWSSMTDDNRQGRAIIDCMINIQLLFWAWKETGNTMYKDVAKAHADTTAKYFIRDDFSVCHSFNFDRKTGNVSDENNDCGYGNGSYWARGTAWAMYGFAATAVYLDDKKYYNLAINIAKAYINQLPKGEYVPVWDFRLPKDKPAYKCNQNIPANWDEAKPENIEFAVDTSAAAVAACAMLELDGYIECKELKDFAYNTVCELCNDKYFDSDVNVPGILKRQNGQMIYTAFGDYFFAEALQRTVNPKIQTCWHD